MPPGFPGTNLWQDKPPLFLILDGAHNSAEQRWEMLKLLHLIRWRMTAPAAADTYLATLTSFTALGVRYSDLLGPGGAPPQPRLSQAVDLLGFLKQYPATTAAHIDTDWFGPGGLYNWANPPVDSAGNPLNGQQCERMFIDAWIAALEASLGLTAGGDDPRLWKASNSQWPKFAPLTAHNTVKQRLLAPIDVAAVSRDRPIEYFWHRTNNPEFSVLTLYGPRRIALVALTPGMV